MSTWRDTFVDDPPELFGRRHVPKYEFVPRPMPSDSEVARAAAVAMADAMRAHFAGRPVSREAWERLRQALRRVVAERLDYKTTRTTESLFERDLYRFSVAVEHALIGARQILYREKIMARANGNCSTP